MKKISQIFVLVSFIFFTGSVVAGQAIKIFEQTAKDDAAWQNYLSAQDFADRESGFLPIHKFADQAYSTALNRNYLQFVPEMLRQPEIYKSIVILFNNLGSVDKIAFSELRDRGRGSGIYLPNMRLFTEEAMTENFEKFKDKIASAIKPNADGEESLSPSILGVLTFLELSSTSYMSLVSENFRNQSNFITAFTSYNEFAGDITLADFKNLAQGDGIWIPVEVEYVKAFTKAFTERTAILLRQETLLKNTSEANMGIKALQDELFRLRQTAGSNSANTEKIKKLEGVNKEILDQLSVLNKDIGNLTKDNLEALEKLGEALNLVITQQKEHIAIQNQAITGLRNELGTKVNEIIVSTNWSQAQIQKLWTAVEGFVPKEALSGLVTKVDRLFWGLIALAVVVVVLFVLSFRHMKISRENNHRHSQRFNQVEGDLLDIRVDQLKVDMSEVEREKISVQSLAKLVAGNSVVVYPVIRSEVTPQSLVIKVEILDDKFIKIYGIPRDEHDHGREHKVFRNTDVLKMFFNAIRKGYYTPTLRAVA